MKRYDGRSQLTEPTCEPRAYRPVGPPPLQPDTHENSLAQQIFDGLGDAGIIADDVVTDPVAFDQAEQIIKAALLDWYGSLEKRLTAHMNEAASNAVSKYLKIGLDRYADRQ